MRLFAVISVLAMFGGSLPAQAVRIDSSLVPRAAPPVTATRVDSAPTSRLWSTVVLTSEDLRNRGIMTFPDALRLASGIVVVQTGSTGSQTTLHMRGGEDDYVAIFIDGVRINEPGGTINLAYIPVDNIARIEILRGPATALYGADAVSGVIQIFTKKAGRQRHSDAEAAWGTEGTRYTALGFSVSAPSTRYSIGAARYRTKGVFDFNNRTWSGSYSGAADFTIGRRSEVLLTARYTDGHYKFPNDVAGVPRDSNAHSAERRFIAGAALNTRLSSSVDATVDLSYSRHTSGIADPPDALTPFPFDARFENERRSALAQLNHTGWRNAVFSIGAQLAQDHNEISGVSYFERDRDRETRSAFAQLLARSEKGFEIGAGLRFDHSDRFDSHTKWRLALGTPLGKSTGVRWSIGTAFREPGYEELTGGGRGIANPDLEVERARTWDAAIEQKLGAAGPTITATYFHQSFFNMVLFSSISGRYENSDRAFANGWEFEVHSGPSRALRLSSGVTILDSRFEGTGPNAGDHLARRPSLFGVGSLGWRMGENLDISGDVSYTGRRSDTRIFSDLSSQQERLGGYARVDLAAHLTIPQRTRADFPTQVIFRVDNALDRRYPGVSGFEAPQRRFSIAVRLLVEY